MSRYDRLLVETFVRPLDQTPVLTVVVPTWERPAELTLAVSSIAEQIDDELAGKVEIIISDNASGPETRAVLQRLSETYPSVNYYIHAENHGGMYQVAIAPHRARGRWTWVFGDDDVLAPGGLKAVLQVLENEQPSFITINRQVWDSSLSKCLTATRHNLPDMRFNTFIDLLKVFGFDQLSFFTSQVYDSELARAFDVESYLGSLCRYAQLPYYLEVFHSQPSYYLSKAVILHRFDTDDLSVRKANFHSLATSLPQRVQEVVDRAGLASDLLEQISGHRLLLGPPIRRITFVDNTLQNVWRCMASGTDISEAEWTVLHQLSSNWRSDRSENLLEMHETYRKIATAFGHYEALVAKHQAWTTPAGRTYSQEEAELIKRSEAAIQFMQGNINDARTMAFEVSDSFD
jgi:glycosyltransferase involved in cell wall biosynthesis